MNNVRYHLVYLLTASYSLVFSSQSTYRDLSPINSSGKREREEPRLRQVPAFKKASATVMPHPALHVAAFLLGLDSTERQAHQPVDVLPLQKMLYYVQGYSLALFNTSLFKEDIIHGPLGPLVWELRDHDLEGKFVTQEDGPVEAFFSQQEKELMSTVFKLKMTKTPCAFSVCRDVPYQKTLLFDKIPHRLIKDFFLENICWVPYIMLALIETKTNEDFENIVRYLREYFSSLRLDIISLENIVDCFDSCRSEIATALRNWCDITRVKWPGQSDYQAFMGHVFFPIQYDHMYETVRQDGFRGSTCISASFGNVRALYHAVNLLKGYALYKDASDERKEEKQVISLIAAFVTNSAAPPYEAGMLCMSLGKLPEAHVHFATGFDKLKDSRCGYRYALSVSDVVMRKSILQNLLEMDPHLAALANESTIEPLEDRVACLINCAKKSGFESCYFTAGLILEKEDAVRAYALFRLAAQHRIFAAYEKIDQLIAALKHLPKDLRPLNNHYEFQDLEKIYKAWGLAGDPRGFIKLGELFYERGNKTEAINCFNRAGLSGIEKRVEFSVTAEEREEIKLALRYNLEFEQDVLRSKLRAGVSIFDPTS